MIAIVKYNAGNIGSVKNALHRLNCSCVITDDPKELQAADKVIFPGVGEAQSAMEYLKKHQLVDTIKGLTNPVLGICLGLQLMCSHSEENDTECLGIFKNRIRLFPSTDIVPHMGWNNFDSLRSQLFRGVKTKDDVYFVHSYYAERSQYTIATANYILPFSAALQRDNFYAVQFHPEKSAGIGGQILTNFLSL